MDNFNAIKITSKDFNIIYRQLFSNNYSNLSQIKKILFNNEENFDNLKYDFKCLRNYILTIYGLSTAFSVGCFYFIYEKISPFFFLKSRHIKLIKYPFLTLIGLTSFQMVSQHKINISHISPFNTKLGLYLILETAYRNNNLENVLPDLDAYFNHIFESFDKSKIKNLQKFELFLFYHDMKSHYICKLMIHKLLEELNGKKYLNMFDKYKYKYYSECETGKDVFYHVEKSIGKEFEKLFMNKEERLEAGLEIPIINKDNYTNYFDDLDSLLLIQEVVLKKAILNEYSI